MIDASATIAAVTDGGPLGEVARHELRGRHRHAPHLIDAEVGNVLRRMARRGELDPAHAERARRLGEALVHQRHAHDGPLAQRAWQLGDRFTFYDALHVALAEGLRCPLLTADLRLGTSTRSLGVDVITVVATEEPG